MYPCILFLTLIFYKMEKHNTKERVLKITVFTLEFLAVGLVIYVFALPFYPAIRYKMMQRGDTALVEAMGTSTEAAAVHQDEEIVKKKVEAIVNHLPAAEYAVSPNRVIITKIGVNAPIVEAKSADYGLSRGAWRVPESSTPDKGGNTVITGHRFKYLPPNNLTFFLFDKLVIGDIVSVIYKDKDYFYRIKEIKVVEPTEVSIMDQTEKPTLTMFTCTPIYSTAQRLVVIAELIEDED